MESTLQVTSKALAITQSFADRSANGLIEALTLSDIEGDGNVTVLTPQDPRRHARKHIVVTNSYMNAGLVALFDVDAHLEYEAGMVDDAPAAFPPRSPKDVTSELNVAVRHNMLPSAHHSQKVDADRLIKVARDPVDQ